ncbi:hypothetical protein TNCV_2220431 [Trichonephila clavipes]|nr:hypothetical protein TNCV_2220431 [Trichonephila clavipes]
MNENPSWGPDAPRNAEVAHFILLTGHDCMRFHLYRMGITDSPDSTVWESGQLMTTEHLNVCPALKKTNCIAEKYWRALPLMT